MTLTHSFENDLMIPTRILSPWVSLVLLEFKCINQLWILIQSKYIIKKSHLYLFWLGKIRKDVLYNSTFEKEWTRNEYFSNIKTNQISSFKIKKYHFIDSILRQIMCPYFGNKDFERFRSNYCVKDIFCPVVIKHTFTKVNFFLFHSQF